MKRFLAAFLSVILCAVLLAGMIPVCADESEVETMNQNTYGLHVESDGRITLEGEDFYGFGLNYFGAFCHNYNNPDPTIYQSAFEHIANFGIPFVRMPLCGYYPSYYEQYDEDPEAMLSAMKRVLDAAAKNHVGVVVSLLWWDPAIPAHVGEKRSDMGVEGSKTLEYARNYVASVVSAFADHPAVWGWEIGNEYNLTADLCDNQFKNFLWGEGGGMVLENINGFDYYTADEVQYFYAEIGKVIRRYDTYRMISTGNGEMRSAAMHMHKASMKRREKNHLWNIDWNQDTYQQFLEINAYYTPDPLDTVCFHLQHGTSGAEEPAYELEFARFGKTVSSLEYFKAFADAAKQQNKAIFFGEFGDMRDMEYADDSMDTFRQIGHWITEAGIQICASWQFQDYTEEDISGDKLRVLSDLNRELVSDGKQKTAAAWEGVVIEDETTAEDQTDDQTSAEKSSGCDSTLAAGAIAVCAGAAAVTLKKKKEN